MRVRIFMTFTARFFETNSLSTARSFSTEILEKTTLLPAGEGRGKRRAVYFMRESRRKYEVPPLILPNRRPRWEVIAGNMCCHGAFWKVRAAHAIPEQVLSNQVTDGSEQLPRQV